ncbi:hypothetical protein [Acinetobacter gerneri]|jgi:hypothetical protein|uniref:hypothetical protein n=1 Tax=Acinetobacter gerneri TaxID=202952 RepID=UPI0023F0626B|nr:hypothetical protein [Acinetobacter gerneri]MCH4243158.1 hypothetical protein [Acinetobacter gerneri]
MSRAAGVQEVDYFNFMKNIGEKNWQGISIFGIVEGMGKVGDLAINSATEKKENKSKK